MPTLVVIKSKSSGHRKIRGDAARDCNDIDATSALAESKDDLTCPITKSLFVDPVRADDNHPYERDAIVEAQRMTRRSPLTKRPISDVFKRDLHALRAVQRLVSVSGIICNSDRADWYRRRAEVLLKQRRQNFDDMDEEIMGLLIEYNRLTEI